MLFHSDGIALDVAIVGLLLLGDGCGVAAVRPQFLPYPLPLLLWFPINTGSFTWLSLGFVAPVLDVLTDHSFR